MSNYKYKLGEEFYLVRDPRFVIKLKSHHYNNEDYWAENVNNYETDAYICSEDPYLAIHYTQLEDTFKPYIKSKLNSLLEDI